MIILDTVTQNWRNTFMLNNFMENLQKYAKLLVAKGINVQPGDWVKMTITVDQLL